MSSRRKQLFEGDFAELLQVVLSKPMGIVFCEYDPSSLFVSSLPLTGEAARSTRLAVGDVLLSVDKISTLALNFEESMQVLADAKGEYLHLRFGRRDALPQQRFSSSPITSSSLSPLRFIATATAQASQGDSLRYRTANLVSRSQRLQTRSSDTSESSRESSSSSSEEMSVTELPLVRPHRRRGSGRGVISGCANLDVPTLLNSSSALRTQGAVRYLFCPSASDAPAPLSSPSSSLAAKNRDDGNRRGNLVISGIGTAPAPVSGELLPFGKTTQPMTDEPAVGCENKVREWFDRRCTSKKGEDPDEKKDTPLADIDRNQLVSKLQLPWRLRIDDGEETGNDDMRSKISLASDGEHPAIMPLVRARMKFREQQALEQEQQRLISTFVAGKLPKLHIAPILVSPRAESLEQEALLEQEQRRLFSTNVAVKVPKPVDGIHYPVNPPMERSNQVEGEKPTRLTTDIERGVVGDGLIFSSSPPPPPATASTPNPPIVTRPATSARLAADIDSGEGDGQMIFFPVPPQPFNTSDPLSSTQQRIVYLVQKHEPERIPLLKKLLLKYRGSEMACLQKIEARYGESPPSADVDPNSSRSSESTQNCSTVGHKRDGSIGAASKAIHSDSLSTASKKNVVESFSSSPPSNSREVVDMNDVSLATKHLSSQVVLEESVVFNAKTRVADETLLISEEGRSEKGAASPAAVVSSEAAWSSNWERKKFGSSFLLAPILEDNEIAQTTPLSATTTASKKGGSAGRQLMQQGVESPPSRVPTPPPSHIAGRDISLAPSKFEPERSRNAGSKSTADKLPQPKLTPPKTELIGNDVKLRTPATSSSSSDFVQLVSELVNYVYGTAKQSDHAGRLEAILLAYKGREQVLLKLLETKAEVKADNDNRILVGGGLVPKEIEYLSEAESDEELSSKGRPALPKKGLTASSQGDEDTISTMSHSVPLTWQPGEHRNEREEATGSGADEGSGSGEGSSSGDAREVDKENVREGGANICSAKAPSLTRKFGKAATKLFGKFTKKENSEGGPFKWRVGRG